MKKAFTLIEIVVAVSLMTAMSGVLMAQYTQYNRRQTVDTTANRLAQVFTEAKVNAQSGKKDCYVCGGVDRICDNVNDGRLLGWRVSINPVGVTNGYRIEGLCVDTLGAEHTFMTRDQQFPESVTIDTLTETEVLFRPLNGGTDLGADMYVSVTEDSGDTSEFMVSQTGEVVAAQPTPTNTATPTVTRTPTPTTPPASCTSSGGKCVPVSDTCYPGGVFPYTCDSGYKCVPVTAQCGNYTCNLLGFSTCRSGSCSGAYPISYPLGGTCPGGWVCCRRDIAFPTFSAE